MVLEFIKKSNGQVFLKQTSTIEYVLIDEFYYTVVDRQRHRWVQCEQRHKGHMWNCKYIDLFVWKVSLCINEEIVGNSIKDARIIE